MSTLKVNKIIPTAGVPTGGGGGVIQVKYGFTTGQIVHSTSTYTDTGLSATITPISNTSKILVMASLNCVQKVGNTYAKVRVLRGSTEIAKIDEGAGYTDSSQNNIIGSISCHIMDSPSTTSELTYKLQFASVSNVSSIGVQINSALSSIILMEVSA